MNQYTQPVFQAKAFTCPHCNAYAAQNWSFVYLEFTQEPSKNYTLCRCESCKELTFWYKQELVYPTESTAPTSHEDMPASIKTEYDEARKIVNISPRGAAALLRLALQKLLKELGGKGKNIHEDIKFLVDEGLPKQVLQALDAIRVIGNESVHPGTIDIQDNQTVATKLFTLINFIIQERITRPREINDIYDLIPSNKRIPHPDDSSNSY